MIGETETGGERIKEDKESAELKPQIKQNLCMPPSVP